jgi:hypothetical protein
MAVAGPGLGLLVDAASYGVSVILLSRVRSPASSSRPRGGSVASELHEGFAEVRSRAWLWPTIAVRSMITMLAVAFPVLGPVVAKNRLGGASAWAAILIARAAGGAVAGTILLRYRPRRPLLVATLSLSLWALPSLMLASAAPIPMTLAITALGGGGMMMFGTLWETTVQVHIPESALSRVSSYYWCGTLGLQPLGFVAIGPLVSMLGVTGALCVCGALQLAAPTALLTIKEIRQLRNIDSGSGQCCVEAG